MNCKSFPRVLIVSRNALNIDGSNGKVLGEFFSIWNKANLAQFYTYNESPNYSNCSNYYKVSDKDALRSLLPWLKVGRRISGIKTQDVIIGNNKKTIPRNPLTYLLKDLLFNLGLWKNHSYFEWLDDFNPEIIVVMAGASSMMHKIAIDISQSRNIPLVIYNTENYYFKHYNYINKKSRGWIFQIYKWECDKMFEKLMRYSAHEIYNNHSLDEQYFLRFNRHGTVIYQPSSLTTFAPSKHKKEEYVFSYAGNLGINRHKSLIEIASTLQEISSKYYLHIYGRATIEVEDELKRAKGVVYHGLVPYKSVLSVIENSDFLIHAESFDPFWIKDLSTAFSTKISDIMASGRVLILYADQSFACTKYVQRNNCGCVINNPLVLKNQLENIINSTQLQKIYIKNATDCVNRDMNSNQNGERFRQVIVKALEDHLERQ